MVELRDGNTRCGICHLRLTDHEFDEQAPFIYILCDGTRVTVRKYLTELRTRGFIQVRLNNRICWRKQASGRVG